MNGDNGGRPPNSIPPPQWIVRATTPEAQSAASDGFNYGWNFIARPNRPTTTEPSPRPPGFNWSSTPFIPPATVPMQMLRPTQGKLKNLLVAAPVQATAPATRPYGSETQWPPSLRSFVDRCFGLCRDEPDRQKMEEALRIRIEKAVATHQVYTTNWSMEPAPMVFTVRPSTPDPISFTKSSKPESISVSPVRRQIVRRDEKSPFEDESKRRNRQKRFEAESEQQQVRHAPLDNAEFDPDSFIVVGTSQELSKPYLRLTSAPDPATVRPQPVLEKSLVWIRSKWSEGAEYGFVCDQLKSIRQDLTVQRIKNSFTSLVYETHARIALEKGDFGEFNQCQTQLKILHADPELSSPQYRSEFAAYRILYMIKTKNRLDLNKEIADLPDDLRSSSAVKFALDVSAATTLGNYVSLFQLYAEAPFMSAYLIDGFVQRERLAAVSAICRSFRPSVPISWLTKTLGFDSASDCLRFLRELKALVIEDESLDTKASSALF